MSQETFFEELRTARETRGITLQEIADRTLINIQFLEAIENGNTSILPAPYVRAFLRQYATAVGLDPVLLMQKYDTLGHAQPVRSEDVAETETIRTEEPVRHPGPVSPWWSHPTVRGIATTVAILAGVILIATMARQRGSPPSQEIPFSDIVRENERRFAPADSIPGAVVPRQPARGDSLILRASATDSVWLQIAVDALPPADYLFPPNAQRSWKAKERFTITLGNAGGVRFRLNNRDLGTLGKPGAVMRNVEVTREDLTSPVRPQAPE